MIEPYYTSVHSNHGITHEFHSIPIGLTDSQLMYLKEIITVILKKIPKKDPSSKQWTVLLQDIQEKSSSTSLELSVSKKTLSGMKRKSTHQLVDEFARICVGDSESAPSIYKEDLGLSTYSGGTSEESLSGTCESISSNSIDLSSEESSVATDDSDSDSEPLTERETLRLAKIAPHFSKYYKDKSSRYKHQKWESIAQETEPLLKASSLKTPKKKASQSYNLDPSLDPDLLIESKALSKRYERQKQNILHMQNQLRRLNVPTSDPIYGFVDRTEKKKQSHFMTFPIPEAPGKLGMIGRCADGRWMISCAPRNTEQQLLETELPRSVDPLLFPLFQQIPFETTAESVILRNTSAQNDEAIALIDKQMQFIHTGSTAHVFLMDVQVYNSKSSDLTQERVAIKLFIPAFAIENTHIAAQEWDDMQRVRDIEGAIQGLGTLTDPATSEIKAIILPYFKGELGDYVKTCTDDNLVHNLLPIFSSVAKSLQEMHQDGLCHNDVKFGNILVHYQNAEHGVTVSDCVLADFQNISTPDNLLDPSDAYCFEKEFFAVKRGSISSQEKLKIRKRMDVRALGLTMYKALSRNEAASPYPLLHKFPDPEQQYQDLPKTIPLSLRNLIRSMLSSNVDDVPTMKEVFHLLDLHRHGLI